MLEKNNLQYSHKNEKHLEPLWPLDLLFFLERAGELRINILRRPLDLLLK